MADTENQQATSQTQQVTSQTPATKQKNPKRVAAGKAIAERTRIAREAQKKALIEAQSIISKADPPATTVTDPPATTVADPPTVTTTQWLSVISIIVSLVTLYYKREEIKSMFAKAAPPSPVVPPPSPVVPRAPPVDVAPARKGGIKKMD